MKNEECRMKNENYSSNEQGKNYSSFYILHFSNRKKQLWINDNGCLRKEIRIIRIITPKIWCFLK